MNKADLITQLCEDTNYSKSEITEILNATLNCLRHGLNERKKITLMGFGTFSVTTRPPRTAINPKTLEKVKVGQRSRVKFKAGKDLVDLINSES